ncbi:PREDICTED: ecdysone receptor-like [Priapulus caudatus]|uniref:Ecdysone receptor-like n=1 Tax=Priapulus caudatus TaxID=37621 RepID=A0ABM1F2I8_PRICU|nr:PREDICTED: ecdysone receptor-like [Priapulus caudatus]
MDMYMRRKCQFCRLRKCKAVGMRPECLVQEPARKTTGKKKDNMKQISTTSSPKDSSKEDDGNSNSSTLSSGGGGGGGSSAVMTMKLPAGLSPEQRELIETLVLYQDQFELPDEQEVRKVTEFPTDENDPEFVTKRFAHITEWTILTVRLIVEFTKRLPGFETLCKEDQITLLKASAVEVILLRSARRYDIETDAVVFGNGLPYTRDSYRKAGIGDTADSIFEFSRSMAQMKVDNAEYALLTAIVIFSERPSLVESRKVEKIQEIYIDALRTYTQLMRPAGTNVLARLLMKLTELRSFSNEHSEMLFSLKLRNHKLPPLLAEIWDVPTANQV